MSTFPLDDPHLAALRNRCWHLVHMCETDEERAAFNRMSLPEDDPITQALAKALSFPASAASLVRDLLARAWLDASVDVQRDWHDNHATPKEALDVNLRGLPGTWWKGVPMPDVPRLISALLDLAPADKEGAMRALREVGR